MNKDLIMKPDGRRSLEKSITDGNAILKDGEMGVDLSVCMGVGPSFELLQTW
jgi:hypothetical protein